MPVYEYKCAACGAFEIVHPIGTAPQTDVCPDCRRKAKRVFSAPFLSQRGPLSTALDRSEKSASEPEMITRKSASNTKDDAPPPRPPVNPKLKKLVGEKAFKNLRAGRHPAQPY